MPNRRILSLWFPRLGAERLIRKDPGLGEVPFAVAEDHSNMQVLSSLSATASAAGLTEGQPLRDAQAMCPGLITRLRNPQMEAQFLAGLRRWAGKFSPWVADQPPGGLIVDLTGCAHLFGGEAALMEQVALDCEDLGLTVQAGIADTPGAAWALARFASQPVAAARSGDAIDQEAWATRSRAAKRRHWERGGPAPQPGATETPAGRIAAPGQTRQAIARLPVAALRLDRETVDTLTRLGLRRIEDLAGQPRAGLARRFGRPLVQRLDQAMGVEPEPVSPAKPPDHFAVRLTLPEPIGLESDIAAALDRLLPRLSEHLTARGKGARRVRLECHRSDHTMQWVEVGLARPTADPDRIRPLLMIKVPEIDAGFGIDCVRVEAVVVEPVYPHQHRGHAHAAAEAEARIAGSARLDDLIGRIGARIGMEAIVRLHPADSHIPEKTSKVLAAAWSEPAEDWPVPDLPRPLLIWPPEIVTAEDVPKAPLTFRWRRRDYTTLAATGPERIAPEWWLDDPAWRSGTRDYWRVTTTGGERLWLFYAHGGALSGGWFCQGSFA
ncbi:Y-family DNA polymerase [Ovoidimarina sediminis]|uniref:Y-family DNA polymerase n=1 Tax=Ovoidimarina sediminis TaxID=3079856 RepID=UPI00290C89FC|nr:DNA polymerase Y family protein [Rhodophyticola sp. MJ-SS7]MDU8944478.1 DNA polymerase Y family protein [Rhodophyticola sp. MJ-SS7]